MCPCPHPSSTDTQQEDPPPSSLGASFLSDELDDTTGLGDLRLGQLADVAGADDQGSLGQLALAQQLSVSESGEVDDGGGVGGALEVLLAQVDGEERPQLLVAGRACQWSALCRFVARGAGGLDGGREPARG